jgi:lipopolysaccharide biosynthesis glycosyltransferase
MKSEDQKNTKTKIVLSIHDRSGHYWMYLAVAIASMLTYARGSLQIVVLHDQTLNESMQQRLRMICEAHGLQSLHFRAVDLPRPLQTLQLGPFTPASLYRLLIPEMFPNEELVLYIDADLIFNGIDITELILSCDNKSPITGVRDPYIHLSAAHRINFERLGLDSSTYVNSGVLAFRPKLIKDNLIEKFIDFGNKFGAVSHPDQDFLNQHFKNKISLLPKKYNFQVGVFERSLLQPLAHYDGKVIHYAGKLKPLDGLLAPGFLPFWRYTALLPELSSHPANANLPRYPFPIQGEAHAAKRVLIRDQPPASTSA